MLASLLPELQGVHAVRLCSEYGPSNAIKASVVVRSHFCFWLQAAVRATSLVRLLYP